MISEGSCDTEDCNNDAENSALHQIFKQNTVILNWNNIYNIFTVFLTK